MSRRLGLRLVHIFRPTWPTLLAGAVVSYGVAVGQAQLAELGVDFRVSEPVGDPGLADAFLPSVDYNSASNEYLVSWHGDGSTTADDELEIFGQRVGADGRLLGSFQISQQGDDGDTGSEAVNSQVRYNTVDDQFLVVWQGDGGLAANGEDEIFGQRVSATGNLLGTNFRISNQGFDGDPSFDARDAAVGYDGTANQFLVAWEGDGGSAADGEFEIFGQRVSALGTPLGDDFRISNQGANGSVLFAAREPAISYNSTASEFLITWEGDGGPAADGENEIFGQRVDATGSPLGTNFRISNQGTAGDSGFDARDPAVSYQSSNDEYLVTWEGDGGLAADGEFEIFAQRVDASGNLVGASFRISHQGPDGDANFEALDPAVSFNTVIDEFLVTWEGTATAGIDIAEDEIFGQRVNSAGALVGDNFRISSQGFDGDSNSDARDPSVIFNSLANDFFAVWEGDGGLSADEEDAIHGQRLKGPPLVPPPGDYNGNGLVEAADYTVWRDELGAPFTLADYGIWRANYGSTGGAATASRAIPEPMTVSLAMVALVSGLVSRFRRRRTARRRDRFVPVHAANG